MSLEQRRWREFLALCCALLFLSVYARSTLAPQVPDQADWERYSVLTPAGPEEPRPEVFHKIKRLLWTEHKVGRNEYRESLAKLYRTTVPSLQTTNNDELYICGTGRKLIVHNQDGRLYEVRKDSETLGHVLARFESDAKRRQQLRGWVVKANALPGSSLIETYYLEKGQRILLPAGQPKFDTFHYPVSSVTRLSSRFGLRRHPIYGDRRMHAGIDIPKPYGTPVYPARSGIVIETGWKEGYGLLVIVRHSDGWTTRYGHLSKIEAHVGQEVQRGKTLLGKVGATGHATGPHLHFEVRDRSGKPVNPSAKIGRR